MEEYKLPEIAESEVKKVEAVQEYIQRLHDYLTSEVGKLHPEYLELVHNYNTMATLNRNMHMHFMSITIGVEAESIRNLRIHIKKMGLSSKGLKAEEIRDAVVAALTEAYIDKNNGHILCENDLTIVEGIILMIKALDKYKLKLYA